MSEQTVRVWDVAVRVFHWSLVLFFTVSYLTGEEESDLHVYSGYIVLGLVIFRIFWGLVGTRYARFTDFVKSPAEVKVYLTSLLTRHPKHYIGHNPAGGWMVILLLVFIMLTGLSGLKVYGLEGHGPLAGVTDIEFISVARADDDEHEDDDEDAAEEWWEEIHEFFANFTVLLIVIHIAGVLVSSIIHGENLPRAMVTGKKSIQKDS